MRIAHFTWRDNAWELMVSAVSWLVAIGAIAFVVAFVVFEAYRVRRACRRSGKARP